MKNNVKMFLGILAIVLFGVLIASMGKEVNAPEENLGGLIETLPVDFTAGLKVNGTEVISSTRALTATSLSVTGSTSLGSTTAGVNVFSPVVTPASDTTLTASQSGTTFNMGVAGLDLTLPAAASANGVFYRFNVSAAFATTNMTIATAGGANEIQGTLIVAGAVVDCDQEDTISFVNDGENVGDFVEMFSNGTNWIIGASGGLTAAKLTCSAS